MADRNAREPLMTGGGRMPQLDVERGDGKKDSYIAATDRSSEPRDPIVYKTTVDEVSIVAPVQFIGLTKEELEKYKDDPFWCRLRWFLFILFWVAWIAMFAIAIAIVVVSPKCPPRNVPEWWQRKVCYQAWTSSFQDSDGDGTGDLNGFMDRMDNLRRIGVQTVRATPLLHTDNHDGAAVVDHKSVDPTFGTNEQLRELIDMAHSNGMYFVLDLPLTVTSVENEWFKKSASTKVDGGDPNNTDYSDFYQWKEGAAPDTQHYSKYAGSNSFYRHVKNQPKQPILRWSLKRVQEKMLDVVEFWLEFGVDGFYLGNADHISQDTSYKPNWAEAATKFKMIRDRVDAFQNQTERAEPILLFAGSPEMENEWKMHLSTDGGLNFVVHKNIADIGKKWCGPASPPASCLRKEIEPVMMYHDVNNETWPMWEIGSPERSRIGSRFDNAQGELIVMLELMLPGALNFYYGDEIGMIDQENADDPDSFRSPMQWTGEEANAGFSTAAADKLKIPVNENYKDVNFDTQYYQWLTPVKMFRRLAKLRQNDEVLMRGKFVMGSATEGDDVFTFSRFHEPFNKGLDMYVGALNFGHTDKTIEFSPEVLPLNEQDRAGAMVITVTQNLGAKGQWWPRREIDLSAASSEKLVLGPSQGVVIRLHKKHTE